MNELTDELINYILEMEAADFSEWVIRDGTPASWADREEWEAYQGRLAEDDADEAAFDWLAANTENHIYTKAYRLRNGTAADRSAMTELRLLSSREDVQQLLDDLVHDRASSAASEANNGGFFHQLQFLFENGDTPASVLTTIKEGIV